MQKQATKLMKSGESSLKTGIFKWKPNYDEALMKFMEASSLFENCQDYVNALKCYEKLALCYEKTEELSGAAEAYEKMGMIYLKYQKDPKRALDLFNKSSSMYKINGNELKAQEILKRLGRRCFEIDFEDLGAEIYKEIINDLFDDISYGTGAEIIPVYQDYLIKKEKYAEAISIYERHIKYLTSVKKYNHIVARCWLGIISIHIVLGEYYIADEKLSVFSGTINSVKTCDEYSAALSLIDAIQRGDNDGYIKILRRPIFTQIEMELVKKLKKFKVPNPEETKKVQKSDAQKDSLFGSAGKPKPKPAEDIKQAVKFPAEDIKEVVKLHEEDKEIVPAESKVEANPVEEVKSSEVKEEEQKKPIEPVSEKKPIEADAEKKPEEQDNDYGGMFT